jgi:hypothetical protein
MSINTGNSNFITTGPDLADPQILDTYNDLNEYSNYWTIINGASGSNIQAVSVTETQTAYTYHDAFKQGDSVTALTNLYNTIQNNQFGQQDFYFDTIVHYFNKFIYSNKEITSLNNSGSIFGQRILPNLNTANSKNLFSSWLRGFSLQSSIFSVGNINSLGGLLSQAQTSNNATAGPTAGTSAALTLADTNVTYKSFFGNVSDSIGTLANSKFIQLDSTQPIFDVTQNYYGVPIPYSASTDSKISNNVRNICYTMSQKTTALMRRNLMNVAYTMPALASNMASDATVAHGHNLMNDVPTFNQINTSIPTLVTTLATNFTGAAPRLFQFIQYLSNIGNQMAVNLRDIFPVTAQDRDFTVIASAERALASEAEINDIANSSIVDSYAEQQGVNYANQYIPSSVATTTDNTAKTIINNNITGTVPGQNIETYATAYSPQQAGSNTISLEGGLASSIPGPDGQSIVRTLQDFATGQSTYVTLAGDPTLAGGTYVIPSITYTNASGENITLTNVPAYVNDTGSAFKAAGTSHLDIPVYTNATAGQLNKQPYSGQQLQLTAITNSQFNQLRNITAIH